MKKTLTAIFLLALVLSLTCGVSAAFGDVASDNPYRNAIDLLDGLGIMQGIDEENFGPNENLTRAEAAKLFYVMITTYEECGGARSGFDDTIGHSLDGYIAWCKSEGIVGGVDSNRFAPDEFITLDQILKMGCAALGYSNFTALNWPHDIRFLAMKQVGLTEGIVNLNGEHAVTRAEAAQILANVLLKPINKNSTTASYVNIIKNSDTIAEGMWKIKKYHGFISATQNFAIGGSALTGKDTTVYIGKTENMSTNAADSSGAGNYTLAALGITEGKADDYFCREIEFYKKDKTVIANCTTVFGSTVTGAELATVKSSSGGDDITKISIEGTPHTISKVWYEFDAAGNASKVNRKYTAEKTYDAAYGEFPVNSTGDVLKNAEVPEILLMIYGDNKQYFSIAIDSDGDKEYDYLFAESQAPYTVSAVASAKITFKELLHTWARSEESGIVLNAPKSVEIAKASVKGTYAKDNIVTAAQMGKALYVTQVVPAKETYLTTVTERRVSLNGEEGQYKVPSYADSIYYKSGHPAKVPTPGVVGEQTKGKYYVADGQMLYFNIPVKDTTITNAKFGVLAFAKGESKWKLSNEFGKYYKEYPVVIDTGDGQITVNVNSIDSVKELSNDFNNVYGRYITSINLNGEFVPKNEFVAYVELENGLYDIYTSETMDTMKLPSKTVMTDKGLDISYVESTKIYKLGDNRITFDENSRIYYINDEGKVSYYTKDTVPSDILTTATASRAYLTNSTSAVKTLRAVMLKDDFVHSGIPQKVDPIDHVIFISHPEDIIYEDEQIRYFYSYISIKDGQLYETASKLPVSSPLAKSVYNGMIGAISENGEVVEIKTDDYPLTYVDKVCEYHEKTKSLFTEKNPSGINVSSAIFIDLAIKNVGTSEEDCDIISGTKTSFEDFAVILNEAKENEENLNVFIGYNSENDNVAYILYSSENNDLFNSTIN